MNKATRPTRADAHHVFPLRVYYEDTDAAGDLALHVAHCVTSYSPWPTPSDERAHVERVGVRRGGEAGLRQLRLHLQIAGVLQRGLEVEGMQKLGGVGALDEPFDRIGVGALVKKRAPWLALLFMSEILTSNALADTLRVGVAAIDITPPLGIPMAGYYHARGADGVLDPLIGRENEVERVVQILCRRTKNNPVLVGEAGVGKTAIVEGLAQRITEGDVPAPLLGKRVLKLDVKGFSRSMRRKSL